MTPASDPSITFHIPFPEFWNGSGRPMQRWQTHQPLTRMQSNTRKTPVPEKASPVSLAS